MFGIVKRNCPERSGGRFGGDWGCRGKGRQPLCPCFLAVEEGIHGGELFEKIVTRCLEAYLGRGSECGCWSGDTPWPVTAVTDCHLWFVIDNDATLYRENAEDRMEFSNVPANSYLSGNLPSSIAPP